MYFDTTGDYSEEFAQFYEAYMAAMDPAEGNGDCSAMAITSDFSKGLYAFEERLKSRGRKLPFVKVQTTGPVLVRPDHRGREQAGHLLQRRVPRRRGQGPGHEVPLADPEVQALRR